MIGRRNVQFSAWLLAVAVLPMSSPVFATLPTETPSLTPGDCSSDQLAENASAATKLSPRDVLVRSGEPVRLVTKVERRIVLGVNPDLDKVELKLRFPNTIGGIGNRPHDAVAYQAAGIRPFIVNATTKSDAKIERPEGFPAETTFLASWEDLPPLLHASGDTHRGKTSAPAVK